jgi:hypothetical protein
MLALNYISIVACMIPYEISEVWVLQVTYKNKKRRSHLTRTVRLSPKILTMALEHIAPEPAYLTGKSTGN